MVVDDVDPDAPQDARHRQAVTASQGVIPSAEFIWKNAREGYAVLDRDGLIKVANPALEDFLGYAPGELVGKSFRDITASVDVAADAAAFDKLLRGEIDSYTMTKLYNPKIGRYKPGRLRVVRLPGTDEILVFGQVLPLDAFDAADVPPEQRAEIVSLAMTDLARMLFKNWKAVTAIVAVIAGVKFESILALIKALSGGS